MRISFLGTGHGVCEPHRKCACSLIEAGGKKYLIDLGCDPMPDLADRGISINDITAVFITHSHGDHLNGLVPMTNQMSWCFMDADPAIYLPEMQFVDALKGWMNALHLTLRESIRFYGVKEGLFYDDGTLRVTAFPTGHMENAYSFLAEAEGKKVLFSGDLKGGDGPVADYARITKGISLDAAVVEAVHFDPMLYQEPMTENPPKKLFINHYSHYSLEKTCRLRKALSETVPTVILTDGYVTEV